MNLLDFPEHILIRIFKHSEIKELRELMMTCVYFNLLISTNKNVMAKLCFRWKKEQDPQVVTQSIKRYQSVRMNVWGNSDRIDSFDMFEKFASTLTRFELHIGIVNAQDIQLMLTYLAFNNKIKMAFFNCIDIDNDELNREDVLAISSLKELHLRNSDCRILVHFSKMQLTHFTFNIALRCADNPNAITDFLKTQNSLENLAFSSGLIPYMFSSDVSKTVNFKLTMLNVRIRTMSDSHARNFNFFLKKQAANMKTLQITVEQLNSLQTLAIILDGVHINNITITFEQWVFENFLEYGNLNTVTHISILIPGVPTEENMLALSLFKNLTSLSVYQVEFNEFLFSVLEKMPKLINLQFINCKLRHIAKLPQVTEMYFNNMHPRQSANFLRMNQQVKKWHISGQHFVTTESYRQIVYRKFLNAMHIDFEDTLRINSHRLGWVAE